MTETLSVEEIVRDSSVACKHRFVFLRQRQLVDGEGYDGRKHRTYDVFFCRRCLAYRTVRFPEAIKEVL